MGAGYSFEEIATTMKRAAAALRDAGVEFALAGSLASWARGGPESTHDLDFVIREHDAERAGEALAAVGMRRQDPPEEWLVKAWGESGVLVDLIFGPSGGVGGARLAHPERAARRRMGVPGVGAAGRELSREVAP